MADIVDGKTRSRMMAGIGTRDTRPEMAVRKLLTAEGIRYRLQRKDLPGKPDIVLPGRKIAVFVNGCFWHGHDCRLFKWPKTRRQFWKKKIGGNQARDRRVQKELRGLGWDVMVVWECALRGKPDSSLVRLGHEMVKWINADSKRLRCKNFRERS